MTIVFELVPTVEKQLKVESKTEPKENRFGQEIFLCFYFSYIIHILKYNDQSKITSR